MLETPEQIPDVLACDVGNTAIHFAAIAGDEVGEVHVLRVGELATLGQELAAVWEQMEQPRLLVACSVNATALKALEAAAQEALGEDVLVISRDLPLPMETDLPDPKTIGVDRLARRGRVRPPGRRLRGGGFRHGHHHRLCQRRGRVPGRSDSARPGLDARSLHQNTDQLPQVRAGRAERSVRQGHAAGDRWRAGVRRAGRCAS